MNGAESLVETLLTSGVDVCFANPGTSEMHFVAALDSHPAMRCILGLQENVVTGAADGYARVAGKPACTLLHCGPGLANGLSNLHNARKARSPVVNVVGDHATYHVRYEAPLTADVEGTAAPYSDWVRTSPDAASLAADGARAVAEARSAPGRVATLIVPADVAWNAAEGAAAALAPRAPRAPDESAVAAAHAALVSGQPALIYCTGDVLTAAGLEKLGRVSRATGCDLLAQTSNRRIERGAGRVAIERLPYPVDRAIERLKAFAHVILLGTREPVGFFAYPGKPSRLAPQGATITRLSAPDEDGLLAVDMLLDRLGNPNASASPAAAAVPGKPSGRLEPESIAAAIARNIPDGAVIADESITTGREFFRATRGARPHEWLHVTGGSIGCGMPQATGAAVGAPDRKVLNLEADGSAMYTLQSLWSQAREGLDVVTLIFSNRAYRILEGELRGVGVEHPGRNAADIMTLDRPALDWVALARGHGVPGVRVEDAGALDDALARAVAAAGPQLIEVAMA